MNLIADQRSEIKGISEKDLIDLCSKSLRFPKLTTINLNSESITDKGVEALAAAASKFNNLQVLNLGNNKITDKFFKGLIADGKFGKLKCLEF